MSENDVYSVIDKVKDELISRHYDWEEAIDTTCAMLGYEFRKLINNKGEK